MSHPVNEAGFVTLNGAQQWVTLRGDDTANPVLLVLSGPGVAFSALAELFAPWERRFTLAHWDQPGAGRTADRHGEDDPLSLERLIADGLALALQLRGRLPAAPLIPLGISGGSIIGLSMLARRPDLFAAYAGQGQIFHWPRQQAASYGLTLDRLRAAGDAAAVAELLALGPPPWPDVAADAVWSRHAGTLTAAELAVLTRLPPPPAGQDPRVRAMTAFARLRADIAGFDADDLGRRFERPLLFLQGEADLYTPTTALETWLADLSAPRQRLAILPGGGHSAVFLTDAMGAGLATLLADL
ncbi:pimeloyl-ACP methyl ester carboxylesterase [Caulobacter ginsengisoli]|uniref:Pimeloyl-ACP methyl ester carboxylesterase n=1 Tax=Caulobacter ginsengisoli TaxID=400775 RepID=A0ABU0IZE9_9CAUL|nr:alpha/beta hydrolase [Caulobacter ginsengisoli]MDQ0466424.1 pimeloyl-ACP methyl ester carboxylesterase [Caulobacter ginsengisoli]